MCALIVSSKVNKIMHEHISCLLNIIQPLQGKDGARGPCPLPSVAADLSIWPCMMHADEGGYGMNH